MGCQDLPWIKVVSGNSCLPESFFGIQSAPRNSLGLKFQHSASEYGFQSNSFGSPSSSNFRNSPSKSKARTRLGVFIPQDHDSARLLFSEEEIKWVSKHFFLLQLTRDEFIVKNSIKQNLSPERIQLRLNEQKSLSGASLFKPQLCRKSMQIVEREDQPKSSYLRH